MNDNLLPLKNSLEDEAMDKASFRAGPSRFDPWQAIAKQVNTPLTTMFNFLVTVSVPGGGKNISMTMCSPEMPVPSDFNLYWNQYTHYRVSVEHQGTCQFNEKEVEAARKITKKILHTAHGSRMSGIHDDFLTYFLPATCTPIEGDRWMQTSTQHWLRSFELDGKDLGIVMLGDIKHMFKRFASKEKEEGQEIGADITELGRNVIVSKYPKRRDL